MSKKSTLVAEILSVCSADGRRFRVDHVMRYLAVLIAIFGMGSWAEGQENADNTIHAVTTLHEDGSKTVTPVRAVLTAFKDDLARPSGVVGPVLF